MDLYCIHLPEQRERLENLTQCLKNKLHPSIDVKINIVEAVCDKVNPSVGCARSHQKIIRWASGKRLDEIIVVEDDVQMNDNFYKIYINAYNDLPDNWDILVGGVSWVNSRDTKRISPNLVQLGDFSATHFMVYRKSSYKRILKWNGGCNIDRYIGRLAKSGVLNVYCATPFIATQFNGYSTIRKCYTNDSEQFLTAEQALLR